MTDGTLELGEVHPMAGSALSFVQGQLMTRPVLLEALASTALSDNRTAEVCYETARRVMAGEPVSDRYILGLAWFLNEQEEQHELEI